MKLFEIFSLTEQSILNEIAVESSWIEDLEINGKDVILTLLSGRQYRVHRFPKNLYNMWLKADSPGKFWHRYVAGKYFVRRID